MDILKEFLNTLPSLLPALAALIGIVVVIMAVRFILGKRFAAAAGNRFRIQMLTLLLSLVGLLVIIIVLPISDSLRGQLLSLVGILLSAAIALSSTTFIGNIMAGLMLRVVRSFRPGDFIRVGDYFGRVSEQSLFHVEIQTEDRDLATMPNLYLVTNPVKVIRSSGTIISADLSLGYDIPRKKIETALIEAAKEVPLEEPFVLVVDLGDYSVSYRVSGLLPEVKQLLSTRSRLRELVMDKLHQAGVEIVSPTFMNTRAFESDKPFIPSTIDTPTIADSPQDKTSPEKVVFDKAEQAESIEKIRKKYEDATKEIEITKAGLDTASDSAEREKLTADIERLEKKRLVLAEIIKRRENQRDR